MQIWQRSQGYLGYIAISQPLLGYLVQSNLRSTEVTKGFRK